MFLGMCVRCSKRQVAPLLKKSLLEWRGDLEAVCPVYWAQWAWSSTERFQAHERENLSHGYLVALRGYIDTAAQRRPEGLSYADLGRLHELEAAIRHELDSRYSRLAEPVGVLDLAAMHAYHCTVRGAQNSAFLADWHSPGDGTLYVQLDYKQHDTLPLGPPSA